MGYIFLSLALTAGIVKAYCGKKTSNCTEDIKDAVFINAIRMLFCVCIGLGLILIQGQLGNIKPDLSVIAIAAFSGFSTAVFVVTWLLSVKKGAYMMVEVFLMLGVFITSMAGSIFFDESIQPNEFIGMSALIIATIIMCSYNNSQKQRLTMGTFLMLVICGVASGLVDFSQKVFVYVKPQTPISIFNFYTYVFSCIFLVPLLLIYSKKYRLNSSEKKNLIFSKIFGYILVMSVCLFANSYFKTKAAIYLDSVQLYPLNQGCALILSTLMSASLFREKITLKCVMGLLVAFIGMILINVI